MGADDISETYDYYNSFFSATKYFSEEQVVVGPGERVTYYVDGSDAYANQNKLFISFQHVPTGKVVFFKAFITAFNETYSSDWSTEAVYGRADPLYMFKQTQRKITLAFKIPAASTSEAYENLGRLQMLVQFLYPVYEEINKAQTVSQSPMVRLKVMNLLKNTNDITKAVGSIKKYGAERMKGDPYQPTADKIASYANIQTWASHDGLLGAIDNVTINHNLEGDDGAFVAGPSAILPKFIDVNMSFSPIHEHPLGWQKVADDTGQNSRYKFSPQTSNKDEKLFPYGVDIDDPIDLLAAAPADAAVHLLMSTPGQSDFEGSAIDKKNAEEAAENQAAVEEQLASYDGLFGQMNLRQDLRKGDETAVDYALENYNEFSDKQQEKVEKAYEKGLED